MPIKAIFATGQTEITVNGLHQWDYGQKLEIYNYDLSLPTAIEVHFACIGMTEAIVRACETSTGKAEVTIPDRCLEQTTPITAWIFEINDTVGTTTRKITMPIEARPRPSVADDLPEEYTNQYTEMITAVNNAVDVLRNGSVVVAKAVEATYASADTSNGTIEDRLNEVPLVANYTIEPNTTYNELVKPGEVYSDSFPVYAFNRRPREGDLFTIAGRTKVDNITFNMCAKATGAFATEDGIEYAEFTAEEIRPLSPLIPIYTIGFTEEKTEDDGTKTPISFDNIVKGYTDSWDVKSFNRVPVVGETFQCFARTRSDDRSFHLTAKITKVNVASTGTYAHFEILDVDPVRVVERALEADQATKDGLGRNIADTYMTKTEVTNKIYRIKSAQFDYTDTELSIPYASGLSYENIMGLALEVNYINPVLPANRKTETLSFSTLICQLNDSGANVQMNRLVVPIHADNYGQGCVTMDVEISPFKVILRNATFRKAKTNGSTSYADIEYEDFSITEWYSVPGLAIYYN